MQAAEKSGLIFWTYRPLWVSGRQADLVQSVCSCSLQGRGSCGGIQQRRGDTKWLHASLTSNPFTPITPHIHYMHYILIRSTLWHWYKALCCLCHTLTHLELSSGADCFDSWAGEWCFRLQGHGFRVQTQWRGIGIKPRDSVMKPLWRCGLVYSVTSCWCHFLPHVLLLVIIL